MKFNSEDAGKFAEVDKFPCAVCRKGVGSTFILCLVIGYIKDKAVSEVN